MGFAFVAIGCLVFAVVLYRSNRENFKEGRTTRVSTENPSPAVTTAPSRSTSAVAPAASRTTIPGAQSIDTTPMTDRQLWEQIEYNTRMSADVLHRMWVVITLGMVLSVIGGIAMAALQ